MTPDTQAHGVIIDRSAGQRPAGSRFGGLGDWISRTFPRTERPEHPRPVRGGARTAVYDAEVGRQAYDAGLAYDLAAGYDPPAANYDPPAANYDPPAGHPPVPAYDVPPVARFPITRQGYDCDTVDAHVADLERELSELEQRLAQAEAQVPSRSEVAIEIERIGEQTSAILVAAHDEAQQTVRAAQSQAETVISDANSYAAAVTEEAQINVRRLEEEAQSLSDRRERLIDEIRSTARSLTSLADQATGTSSSTPAV